MIRSVNTKHKVEHENEVGDRNTPEVFVVVVVFVFTFFFFVNEV